MNAYILAILTALIWGIVPILEKIGLRGASPIAGLAVRCGGVILGLVCLLFFFPVWGEISKMSGKTLVYLFLGGFLASVAAQFFFYHALKIGDVSRIVPISGTYPLIAFILGIMILGEKITLAKTAGAVLVVIGLTLLK